MLFIYNSPLFLVEYGALFLVEYGALFFSGVRYLSEMIMILWEANLLLLCHRVPAKINFSLNRKHTFVFIFINIK